MSTSPPQVYLALDFPDAQSARNLALAVDPQSCGLKVGKQLFTSAGPGFVSELVHLGFSIFLDLKYHDIPNTVHNACAAAADLGVDYVNVHALGGSAMMEAAGKALQQSKTQLLSVTVLTSLGDHDLHELGLHTTTSKLVEKLAVLSRGAGLSGVVCSAQELRRLRTLWPDIITMTPGIRPVGVDSGDQHRVSTPTQALRDGASHIVIGRAITQASDPQKALVDVLAECAKV